MNTLAENSKWIFTYINVYALLNETKLFAH